MIDEQTRAAIRKHAKELVATAPPFTTTQADLLVSIFSRYPNQAQAVSR